MGVYLSTPNTELDGTQDGRTHKLVFGAASMQGWRVGQEDAHIAIADFDADTSLFGVFDGHGGPEVSKYCAQHLPDFIKSLSSYQNNNLKECLEEAFLKFDKSLIQKEVIEELKILSGNPEVDNDRDSDEEINEAILLREEADLPMSELMKRYGNEPEPKPDPDCCSSSDIKPGLSLPLHLRNELKERAKPCSPYLRAKRSSDNNLKVPVEDSSNGEGSCSSTSAEAAMASSEKLPETREPDTNPQVNEAKIESSTDTASESENVVLNGNSDIKNNGPKEDTNPTTNEGVLPKEDSKDTDKKDETNEVDTVTSDSTESPYKGKGKYKKIPVIKETKARPDSTTDKPIYEYFMEDFDEEEESDDSEDFQGGVDDSSEEEELGDISEEESESEDEDEEDDKTTPTFEKPGYDSGCTAVVAILRGNQLFVANAGDSRCVVARDGNAIDMSVDHKPEDDIERERIAKAGGKVTRDGRVNGGLNLSRAIGDHAYKQNELVSDRDQMITALPDIRTLELSPKTDSFMVIACDGIWNSMTSQQVVDYVAERIEKTDKLSTICDELFRSCLAPNTHGDGTGCDNMTAVIVKFVSDSNLKRKFDEIDTTSAANDIQTETTNAAEEPNNKVEEKAQTKKSKAEEEMGPEVSATV